MICLVSKDYEILIIEFYIEFFFDFLKKEYLLVLLNILCMYFKILFLIFFLKIIVKLFLYFVSIGNNCGNKSLFKLILLFKLLFGYCSIVYV